MKNLKRARSASNPRLLVPVIAQERMLGFEAFLALFKFFIAALSDFRHDYVTPLFSILHG